MNGHAERKSSTTTVHLVSSTRLIASCYVNQHIALARPSQKIDPHYLAMYLTSPEALGTLKRSQRGIKNSLGLEDIRAVRVQFPDRLQQEQVVAKTKGLLSLCDRLEYELKRARVRAHVWWKQSSTLRWRQHRSDGQMVDQANCSLRLDGDIEPTQPPIGRYVMGH